MRDVVRKRQGAAKKEKETDMINLGRAARRALDKGKKKIDGLVAKGLISRERVDELVSIVARDRGYGDEGAKAAKEYLKGGGKPAKES